MFRLINLSFVTFDALTSHFSRFVNNYYNYNYTTKVIDIRVEGVRGGTWCRTHLLTSRKFFYSAGGFLCDFWRNHPQPPTHTPLKGCVWGGIGIFDFLRFFVMDSKVIFSAD